MQAEDHDKQEIQSTLRRVFPPVEMELNRDLWPEMLRRLSTPPVRVPWYDWALAAGAVASMLLFPRLALFLFAYHL